MSSSAANQTGDKPTGKPVHQAHPDFKTIEASRPDWDTSKTFEYIKTISPDWKFGNGANHTASQDPAPSHVSIDPYAPGRPQPWNYKLLIGAIVPRPIGFTSTVSALPPASDIQTNLAPFSYFNTINHDPPLFILGISTAGDKDTLRNLRSTGQATINLISEHFIEAANATAINSPPHASEWAVSGLTPVWDCATVAPPRVKESLFSVECVVESIRDFESRNPETPGKKTCALVVLEGKRFWAREDVINEERSMLDIGKLRPMARLGGITYGRVTEGVELPRFMWNEALEGVQGGYEGLKERWEEGNGKGGGVPQ